MLKTSRATMKADPAKNSSEFKSTLEWIIGWSYLNPASTITLSLCQLSWTPPLCRVPRQQRTPEELREAARLRDRRHRNDQMTLRRHNRALGYCRNRTYQEIYLAITTTITGFLNIRPSEDDTLAHANFNADYLYCYWQPRILWLIVKTSSTG